MSFTDFELNGSVYITSLIEQAIKNIYGRSKYAVALAGEMQGLVMYGIECADGCKMLLDERVKI